METMQQRIAVVRATPYPPHKRRWCGLEQWVSDPERRSQQDMDELPAGGFRPKFDGKGKPLYAKHALPWPDTEIRVVIVDHPKPFDPNANGGAPVEISPATLSMLESDPKIAVRVLSGPGGDPAEVIHAKAQASKLEVDLQDARREMAAISESEKTYRASSEELVTEVTAKNAKIAALEQELAAARASIAKKR